MDGRRGELFGQDCARRVEGVVNAVVSSEESIFQFHGPISFKRMSETELPSLVRSVSVTRR